jgi:CubicO group peptidase (beta-lactamase class C family)
MRPTTLRLLVAFLMLGPLAPTALAASAEPTPERVEAMIDAVVGGQLAAGGIPGATVAVVVGGESILVKGYGLANVEDGSTVDADTLFRIGSVAKLLTFTAVMQLVEQGRLDLDADIATYLDFALPRTLDHHPFRGDPGPITLAHLLTHTAGFEDARGGGYFLDAEAVPVLAETLRDRMPARIFRPGEAVAYSNYGAALAGYIVERIAGQPFAAYVEEHVFAPLAMDRSTFAQPLPPDLAPHLARASRVIDGQLQRDRFVYVAMTPAGSMSTTASDMASFMLAHLGDGGAILAPETARLMHDRQFDHHPRLDGMAFGFVERTVNGQRALFHGGDIFSFQSGLFLLPEHGVGLFVSYSGGGYGEPLTLFHDFVDAFYPAAVSDPPRQAAGAAERSRAFVGEYHANRRSYSSDEALLGLMEAIQVQVDAEGFLTASVFGETARFAEVEPGVYATLRAGPSAFPYGALNTLVFRTDDHGRTMLFTDGKVSYAAAPWFTTTGVTLLAVGGTALVSLLTLVGWSLASAVRRIRRRRSQRPRVAQVARWTAAVFAGSVLVSLLGVVLIGGTIDPIFGQPLAAFGVEPGWSPLLDIPAVLLVVTGLALTPLAVVAWHQRLWGILARLHYTLLAALALVLLAALAYWNLLF